MLMCLTKKIIYKKKISENRKYTKSPAYILRLIKFD